jgi:RNA-directed DNA polymerase
LTLSGILVGSLDHYLWHITYKWATWRHENKPKRWIVSRYFGKYCKFRNDHWVFGDRDSGACLVRFSWTAIERHVPVTGAASPDDPALASYWAERRKKIRPPLDRYSLYLLSRQDGLCPLCGDHLLSAGQPPQSPGRWEQWWLHVTRRAIAASYLTHGRPGPADEDQTRLVHASCQRALQTRQRRKPHFNLQRPRGLLEPCAATSGTHGSEGAPAGKPAGATRRRDVVRSSRQPGAARISAQRAFS